MPQGKFLGLELQGEVDFDFGRCCQLALERGCASPPFHLQT